MRLYFTDGCPYAQRTRALLTLLEQPFTPEVVDLKNKSPEFLALTPTGAVPLLVDDGLVLFESAVVNEYLAEKFRWAQAFAPDLAGRARQRLAIKRFDDAIVPTFFQSFRDPGLLEAKPNWKKEVTFLGAVAAASHPVSLLGLHVATHWVRMGWLAPQSPMVVALHEAAGPFLDAAAALPSVVATLPEREAATRGLRAMVGLS